MRDVSKLRVAMLGGLLAAVLALAGCGGSSHSASASPTSTTPTTAANGAGRFAALRTCLQQHGITLPQRTPRSTTPGETFPRRNGGGGGGGGFGFGGGGGGFLNPPPGVSQTDFQNALKACGAGNGGGGFNSSALAAYRSCLSDHGVKLPAQGSTSGSTSPTTINRNDPKVVAAMKACAPLLPAGFGRGRNGSTTTTTPAS
jgi:hypothetical protein